MERFLSVLRTDPNRKEALKNYKNPSGKATIQSFLGMVDRRNNFLPNTPLESASLNHHHQKNKGFVEKW